MRKPLRVLEVRIMRQHSPLRIVLHGAPGSGKGTQGQLLEQRFGIPRLSIGALIRRHIHDRTPAGQKAHDLVVRGLAVPGQLLFEMLTPWLDEHPEGFVVDNLVRTHEQLEAFRAFQKKHHFQISYVFHLIIPEEAARKRLAYRKGRAMRADETPEAIQQRFDTYMTSRSEILTYFQSLGVLREIDAEQSPEAVFRDIMQHMGESI